MTKPSSDKTSPVISNAGYASIRRPSFPRLDQITKYLEIAHENKFYTNFGALNKQFIQRLRKERFSEEIHLATCSSGTSAIICAILATAGRASQEKPLCLLPSYTFAGTIIAVIQCGYVPYLLDLKPGRMCLDKPPEVAPKILSRVGLLLPVCSYGVPIDFRAWEEYSNECKIPIVVDAAACFDTLQTENLPSDLAVCISTHATKIFSTAEGGIVLSRDQVTIEKVVRATNFGFYGSRTSIGSSTNSKLSEYHAAVGLAFLDNWSTNKMRSQKIKELYFRIAKEYGIIDHFRFSHKSSNSYMLFDTLLTESQNNPVIERLKNKNVDFRYWYGSGLHRHPAFQDFKSQQLTNTNQIARRIIGLPMHNELSTSDVEYIINTLYQSIYNSL